MPNDQERLVRTSLKRLRYMARFDGAKQVITIIQKCDEDHASIRLMNWPKNSYQNYYRKALLACKQADLACQKADEVNNASFAYM